MQTGYTYCLQKINDCFVMYDELVVSFFPTTYSDALSPEIAKKSFGCLFPLGVWQLGV